MTEPTTITETEGEWARDAAYALDQLGDPNTFTSEAIEHIAPKDILADAAYRMSERRFVQDLERTMNALLDGPPRKERP